MDTSEIEGLLTGLVKAKTENDVRGILDTYGFSDDEVDDVLKTCEITDIKCIVSKIFQILLDKQLKEWWIDAAVKQAKRREEADESAEANQKALQDIFNKLDVSLLEQLCESLSSQSSMRQSITFTP
ncbi:hypothetical protein [Thiomicrospira sp.]|uniref:hypothetical protein n=1 Tax=Thiomicrospira sp. TaxID=935 RepID=UPI002F92B17C